MQHAPKHLFCAGEEPEEGAWVRVARRGYGFVCCDCGLVHRLDFDHIPWGRGRKVILRAWRDDIATKRERKAVTQTNGRLSMSKALRITESAGIASSPDCIEISVPCVIRIGSLQIRVEENGGAVTPPEFTGPGEAGKPRAVTACPMWVDRVASSQAPLYCKLWPKSNIKCGDKPCKLDVYR